MLTVRASTIEAYRRVCETDYGSEANLIASLMRGQPDGGETTRSMEVGLAWHRAIGMENPDDVAGYDDDHWERFSEFWFRGADVRRAVEETGPGQHEVRSSRIMDVFGTPVCLTAKCDHIIGSDVTDHKTRIGTVDASSYDASLQHRCYLWVFQATSFRYLLYSFKEGKGEDGFFTLKEIVPVRHFPYERMEDDLRLWMSRFLEWAHVRRLSAYLDPDLRPKGAAV